MGAADVETAMESFGVVFGREPNMVEAIDDDAAWAPVEEKLDPEAEVRFIAPGGGLFGTMGGPFHGIDGWRAGWREWLEPYSDFRVELEDVLDAGEGKVVILVNTRAQPKGADSKLQQEAAALVLVEGGRIVGVDHYLDQDEARGAAGLR